MLERLHLINWRNYHQTALDFSGGRLNVFYGPNGAGKTNLLEAIFFLGILRSFRAGQLREVIRQGTSTAIIEGDCLRRGTYRERLRVEITPGARRRLSIDEMPIGRSSDFIRRNLPVAFTPNDIQLVAGTSALRRRFTDMSLSLLDGEYLRNLNDFTQALRQRNALFKHPRSRTGEAVAASFEPVLAQTACFIVRQRKDFIKRLETETRTLLRGLNKPDDAGFAIRYVPDYPENPAEYLEKLRKDRPKEWQRSHSLFGPQTDDFDFFYQGRLMRSYASTGQMRLVALHLKMASVTLLSEAAQKGGGEVVVLVDDVTGELDEENTEQFFHTVNMADQAFFTLTASPLHPFFQKGKFFQLTAGKVEAVPQQ